MALLIDTDVLIDLVRGVDSEALELLMGEEERAVSVVTMSELLHGVHRATEAQRHGRRAAVEHLLAETQAIPITEPVARVHAEIWSGLAGRGELLGPHDLWIAATAMAHGFGVVTRDRAQFDRVPGLRVVSPA